MFYHLITEFVCFFSKLDNTAHEQTIICRTRVGISANEKEETLQQMIIITIGC